MARTHKVTIFCDKDEIPIIRGVLGDRLPHVHMVFTELYDRQPTKIDREKIGEMLAWPSVAAFMKAFDKCPVCRPPDFKFAMQSAGFAPDGWSNAAWMLVELGVLRKLKRGVYVINELRTGGLRVTPPGEEKEEQSVTQ